MFMETRYTYKKQGNGLDSWRKESDSFIEMVFDIDVLSWKLKAILTQRGLYSQVESALNTLPEPNKTVALFAWNGAPNIHITSNTTKFIQGVLGLTIQEVTSIFESATNLEI